MNNKIYFAIIIFLFLTNMIFLYMSIHYRNILIERNNKYFLTPSLPLYKNINYEFIQLKDNLSFYKDAIVFIGSSIIAYWDFEAYFKDEPFINRGICDNNSSDLLNRFNDDVIILEPKAVVIYIGANDIKQGLSIELTINNLQQMIKLSYENNIKPLVLTVAPIDYSNNPALEFSHPSIRIKKMIKAVIHTCINNNTPYIDLNYQIMIESNDIISSLLCSDGLHFNKKGYDILSQLVKSEIYN